jgi:hypothetical protein
MEMWVQAGKKRPFPQETVLERLAAVDGVRIRIVPLGRRTEGRPTRRKTKTAFKKRRSWLPEIFLPLDRSR